MFCLRTKQIAGGAQPNYAFELTPVGRAGFAFSCHDGCGAAVAPAASRNFMITGPVQLNFLR